MLKCVFGIDGGGTKTVCLLADQNGLVRGRGEYGASNPNYISAENLKSTLRQVIEAATLSSGLSSFDLVGICLGVAGAGRREKQDSIRDLVWEILTETNFRDLGMRLADGFQPQSQIQVYGDTVIALVAGAKSR